MTLLGSSGSGKSTIMKQMDIIYQGGISEKNRYQQLVYENIYSAIADVVQHMNQNQYWSNFKYKGYENIANKIVSEWNCRATMPDHVGIVIEEIWSDSFVRSLVNLGKFVFSCDSSEYFLNNISRIGHPSYCPSDEDIIRGWCTSTGIYTQTFNIKSAQVEVIDTSGARSERRKWRHCFQPGMLVVFCVALTDYSQRLSEDKSASRMTDSLQLFKDIANSKELLESSMIIIFTKADHLRERIEKTPLSHSFVDYTGEDTFEAALSYIANRYLSLVVSRTKPIYTYVVDATNTEDVRSTFSEVYVEYMITSFRFENKEQSFHNRTILEHVQ
ncbi:hypothetical protein HYPSUDRAFT_65621 [Hypholoma sublateritium FD-334 SS-4]|uniref:G-protein alpha subunit n=1 Tax=Hypholoma sublateritium (strain FD-334 SS-4) TaxID=945553 RepID=A0A0D2PYC3_HYPSF|nr:hypothetical protein HYPSUDRAFT_65621 [Hypholoma sublateritium FD-334 SS-4]